MEKITAPFTDNQVLALNHYQEHTWAHPFTCGGENCKESDRNLVATNEGWVCPCGKYKQDWAHKFMAIPMNDYQE